MDFVLLPVLETGIILSPSERRLNMRLSFNDLIIELSSSRKDFTDYLERIYGSLKTADDKQEAHIVISVAWSKDPSDFKDRVLGQAERVWKRVGAQTYIAQKACLYNEKIDKRNTQIFLTERDQRLFFEICRKEKPLSDFFRKDKEDQLREWVHYFVFFPLFFYGERFRGLHPLHAALAVFHGKNVVIMGLENTGKTSLTLEMARRENALLLSDNLCLYGGERVYPCHQPIKSRRGDNAMGRRHFQPASGTRHREYYFPDAPLPCGYAPDLLILPCFAHSPFTKELSAVEAARFVFNANFLVSELKKYVSCAHIWNFALDAESFMTAQRDHLARLVSRCRCYQIGIGPRESVPQTVDRIQRLLEP